MRGWIGWVGEERAGGRKSGIWWKSSLPSGSHLPLRFLCSEKCGRTTLERKDGRWGSVTRAASVVRIGEQVKNTQDKRLKPKFS